jgi:hypothetical protein
MSWNRPAAADALVSVLTAATAANTPPVWVHDKPPSTLNAPSLVVSYPTTVVKHSPTFPIDQAAVAVLGAVGVEAGDDLDGLLAQTTTAVEANPTLSGAVQYCQPTEWRNWRIMTSAGASLLVAEVALEIRM